MVRTFLLAISNKPDKKFRVDEIDNEEFKTVYFGSASHSDYTLNKDPLRKKLYKARHKKNENWKASGIDTAGWWAIHLLWNKPSLVDSIKDTENRFDIRIIT